MRFLFDQSADRRLVPHLRGLGHDVTVVAVDYPEALSDDVVLGIVVQEGRILVAEDADFGELVFRRLRPHSGVLFLRLPPMELHRKIVLLNRALSEYADRLDQFVVVTVRGVRVRTVGS